MTPHAEAAIDAVLDKEGGYSNRPNDRGGPTNLGITMDTLAAWRGMAVTAGDVQSLTRDEAIEIYNRRYVEEPGLEVIGPFRVFAYVVDMSANMGPRRAVKILQKALGVTADGILGPITARAANAQEPDRLLHRLRHERAKFYAKIVAEDPSQREFLVGWINRTFEAAA